MTTAQIKSACRAAYRKYHPDKVEAQYRSNGDVQGYSDEVRKLVNTRACWVNNAIAILNKPETRLFWD